MPHFMDIHRLPEGVTADMVRDAHNADMQLQAKYGVKDPWPSAGTAGDRGRVWSSPNWS